MKKGFFQSLHALDNLLHAIGELSGTYPSPITSIEPAGNRFWMNVHAQTQSDMHPPPRVHVDLYSNPVTLLASQINSPMTGKMATAAPP